jgi:N-formylglutamate amidohydrolase
MENKIPCHLIHCNFGIVFVPSLETPPPVLVTVQHCGLGQEIFQDLFLARKTKSLTDLKTLPLALDLFRAASPHVGVIYNQFNRRYLETNVPPDEAYRDQRLAAYYDSFHQKLAALISESSAVNGPCVLLDLHGFGAQPAYSPPGGYDAILGTGNRSTVRVADKTRPDEKNDLDYQLRDELEKSGLSVFCPESEPVRKTPDPFNGGYLIRKHSENAELVAAAIQIELAYGIRDRADETNKKRDAFIKATTAFIKRICA